MTRPDLRIERTLLRAGARFVAGMDEVGRGALAGPVSVGVVVVDLSTRSAPPGVADSKLLSPARRAALAPALMRWPVAWAVGHAEPTEIDAVGIVGALRLAGSRALDEVARRIGRVDAVLLDGSHDWLTPEPEALLDLVGPTTVTQASPTVHLRVKADRTCSSVAAASVLAKVIRDGLMDDLAREHPGYGWEKNKGYGSADHVDALRDRGVTTAHRRSWRLPGVDRYRR